MSNMIGVKSGVDWANIPSKYIAVDSEYIGGYQNSTIFCYMDSKGHSRWDRLLSSGNIYDEGRSDNTDWGTDRYILKQDDLPQHEQEKQMEYKCLQDLPVGTFVKFKNVGENYACVWTGETLATMAPQYDHSRLWEDASIGNFEGFNYTFNGDCSIVSYSDKYGGDYRSLVPVKASTKETPWKIKHLKSPTYTRGKDVALTILYRVVDNVVQYKYSICSKEDMFCKRTGVEVANNSTLYSYKPDITTGTALQTALYSLSQHSVSRQVKKLINNFLNSK